MHMADALLSPAVGGTMWAATAGTIGYCAKKVREEMDDSKVPLMGVLGAFIFASQMINFTIPATGSSGHLGGGMILAILLGPYAAFLAMASVLTVQALFFADGGLLALGCNIFNLGVFPCFVAYPLLYKPIVGGRPTQGRLTAACLISAIVGLQLGAFGVVLQTVFSGVSELPFGSFVLLMQPIHLGIGFVEGLATAAVVGFVWKAQPAILEKASAHQALGGISVKGVLGGLAVAALMTGAVLSWFASPNPDGLEWAIAKVTEKGGPAPSEPPSVRPPPGPAVGASSAGEPASKEAAHSVLAALQEKLAFLPDYGFRRAERPPVPSPENPPAPGWPTPDASTSVSGIVGGMITLAVAVAIGLALRRSASA